MRGVRGGASKSFLAASVLVNALGGGGRERERDPGGVLKCPRHQRGECVRVLALATHCVPKYAIAGAFLRSGASLAAPQNFNDCGW